MFIRKMNITQNERHSPHMQLSHMYNVQRDTRKFTFLQPITEKVMYEGERYRYYTWCSVTLPRAHNLVCKKTMLKWMANADANTIIKGQQNFWKHKKPSLKQCRHREVSMQDFTFELEVDASLKAQKSTSITAHKLHRTQNVENQCGSSKIWWCPWHAENHGGHVPRSVSDPLSTRCMHRVLRCYLKAVN